MRIPENTIVLGKDCYVSRDTHETQINNNVMVVGGPGTGKTRGIVIPNILQAEGSYVISDPKGNLCDTYGPYLEEKGYVVKRLDFVNPERSIHYNPLKYTTTEQDYVKLGNMLATATTDGRRANDPFWEQTNTVLMAAMIALTKEMLELDAQTMVSVFDLLGMISPASENSRIEQLISRHVQDCRYGTPFSVRQYRKVKNSSETTFRSILITTLAGISAYDTEQMREVFSSDETDICEIGRKKTAVFVVVSDTDRSMDVIANVFFTQALNELCNYADRNCKDNCLPIPVQFIMDDFATNCRVEEFPRMISSFRSRGISTIIMLQAESQLEAAFRSNGRTVVAGCDTILYLGGNDLETAKSMSERCDKPVQEILNIPVGKHYVFQRGKEASLVDRVPLEELDSYRAAMKLRSNGEFRKEEVGHLDPFERRYGSLREVLIACRMERSDGAHSI